MFLALKDACFCASLGLGEMIGIINAYAKEEILNKNLNKNLNLLVLDGQYHTLSRQLWRDVQDTTVARSQLWPALSEILEIYFLSLIDT
jgi:hypothetical protein